MDIYEDHPAIERKNFHPTCGFRGCSVQPGFNRTFERIEQAASVIRAALPALCRGRALFSP